MKPRTRRKSFCIGALIGPALGLAYLLTGGDVALPLVGAGPVRIALVYALWPGFATGGWVYDHASGGRLPVVYFAAGFLALALAYGLLGLVAAALSKRTRV